MAEAANISVLYADNPWGDLSMLERSPAYVPNLMATYKRQCKWGRFVQAQIDFTALRARQMVLSRQIHGRPDFSPKSAKTLMFPVSTFVGLQRKTIEIEYHYDKIQWHSDDDLFNFTDTPMETLARNELGWNMAQYFDYLSRQAAMDSVYQKYPTSVTDFAGLTTPASHKFNLTWVAEILLGMEYEDLVDSETGMPAVACLTTPGVIHDIVTTAGTEWRDINTFSEAGRTALMEYGIRGTYKGVGFIPTTVNTLWGAGPIAEQVGIAEPVNTLDGTKDEANTQGWNSAQDGIKPYIQLHSAMETGTLTDILAGDMIVIHRERSDALGVTNGVNPNEGRADHRVVAEVDDTNKRIYLVKPWLKDGLTVADGNGFYGYVTAASNVHMSSFIADTSSLMMGVAQVPTISEPSPFDDMQKMHRVAWDFHGAISLMNHQGIRNAFTLGSVVNPGSIEPVV